MKSLHSLHLYAALVMGSAALLASCSSSDSPLTDESESSNPEINEVSKGSIVVGATVDEVNYLVTANSLDEGVISIKGKGKETEEGAYWIFKDNRYLFRLVYNQGNSGTGSSYQLDADGKMVDGLTYNFNRVTTYGTWGDNVITASAGNSTTKDKDGNIAKGLLVNYLSSVNGTVKTHTYPAENFLGNGEYVSFSGFVEANNRLYTSVVPMGMSVYGVKNYPQLVSSQDLIAKADGGQRSSAFVKGSIPATQYPDSAFVAIYSGSDFSERPVIARTGKIGYATGRNRSQYYQTIWANDNGDVYVFSPGYGRFSVYDTQASDLKKVKGQLPSGVVRIKKGETQFDPSYYVNLEAIGPKLPMYRCWHITGDYFLLQLYTQGITYNGVGATRLAVFNAATQSLTAVTGLPDERVISDFGESPYTHNGYCYLPVTTTEKGSYPAFYRIDPRTAVAVKGATVEAESVNATGWLNRQ